MENKINTFLLDDKKPPRQILNHTVTLDYNSHRVQQEISALVKKMKKLVPNFTVISQYKTYKIFFK